MLRFGSKKRRLAPVGLVAGMAFWFACHSVTAPETPTGYGQLSDSDVETLLAHAVELALGFEQKIVAAVVDREGNLIGLFRMNATEGPYVPPTQPVPQPPVSLADEAVQKARTAAFLSSNQHAFTTLTACFITRAHFPPVISNTPAGPLFGVPYSSLPGSDIQPNGNGLGGAPGGVPLFKAGLLAGGIGIAVVDESPFFEIDRCEGETFDEKIALGAATGLETPAALRGDGILIDGIRFLYAYTPKPQVQFTLSFVDIAPAQGTADLAVAAGPPKFPISGEVVLDPEHDFHIRSGQFLTALEVRRIIAQAEEQANRTRAAIRRPIGVPARVFITVVDVDGSVLGIWRTTEATIFSFDVSAQKARTALAFSSPDCSLGQEMHRVLGLPATQPLAVSTRAVGFLCQDFFPPGIDLELEDRPLQSGPLFQGPNFQFQQNAGLDPCNLSGNGITIFPGGIPLYKDGQLVGGIGVSGDGVDQDDIIAFFGASGFEPPDAIRSDRFTYQDVRLPYVKFPRQPNLP